MRIYLAGSSKQRPFVAYLARQIEQQGHQISHPWWVDYDDTDRRKFAQAAQDDLRGVAEADAFIAVLDGSQPSLGAHLEMGYAMALQIPTLALVSTYDMLESHIWLHLPNVVVAGLEEMANLNDLDHWLQIATQLADLQNTPAGANL